MYIVIVLVLVVILVKWMFSKDFQRTSSINKYSEFTTEWRTILMQKVAFYNSLSDEEKAKFETKILEFLNDVRVTGIDTKIDDSDRILVASSAIIPIFAFEDWRYNNINEVLIYPSSFNERFETAGPDRQILGMVGTGAMNGNMILSQQALHQGFINESDKHNTAIHEFVHLIDKTDGEIDGLPEVLLRKQYTLPWLNLIAKEIEQINKGKSDINPYGGTSNTEFLAVASEYFFEQPKLLEKKHPELYKLMEQMFNQKMNTKNLTQKKSRIGRNDLCPCNKGEKFKNCCGSIHFLKN